MIIVSNESPKPERGKAEKAGLAHASLCRYPHTLDLRAMRDALDALSDRLIEAYEYNTPEAAEDRARDWFHSGQPMGDWDH